MTTPLVLQGATLRQTRVGLLIEAFLQSPSGALVTGGATTFNLREVQNDLTLKSYDFSQNLFTASLIAGGNDFQALTYRKSNAGTVDDGYWNYLLPINPNADPFTVGAQYRLRINNTAASPTDQTYGFQYGGCEGDLALTPVSVGVAHLRTDMRYHAGVPAEVDTYNRLKVDVEDALGVPAAPTDPFAAPLGGYASNTLGGVLQTIGSGQVSVVTAVTASGDVTLTRGASYFAADGRALTFTDASGAAWPDLTGAAATWQAAAYRGGPPVLTTAATVVSPSGAGKTVRVEPSAADTAFLVAPNYVHELWATLANGHKVLLAAGAVTVAG